METLRQHLSRSEERFLTAVAARVPKGGAVVVSKLANELHVAAPTSLHALKLASIAGIIRTRSMGRNGTMIAVENADAWAELAQSA